MPEQKSPDAEVIDFPGAVQDGQECPRNVDLDEGHSIIPPKPSNGLEMAFPWRNEAHRSRKERPWFSLACIMGNEAHHIERFLASFEPLVDEIVIVRACGAAVPDKAVELAAKICQKPLLIAEYKNEEGLDWLHVDNFAKARQMAWDLAEGEFKMWADLDDVIEQDMALKLRSQVDLGNFDVLFMQYKVIGAPILQRERVMRKGFGHWCGAVHEAVSLPANFKRAIRMDIEVFHAPTHDGTGKPKGSSGIERIIRILERRTGSLGPDTDERHRDRRDRLELVFVWRHSSSSLF